MKIEVKIPGVEANLADKDRRGVSVETHVKRNDTFNIQKVDTVMEGAESVTFEVPPGGRLVINTPEAKEEMVYDKDQAASIRTSAQVNAADRADKPGEVTIPAKERAPEVVGRTPSATELQAKRDEEVRQRQQADQAARQAAIEAQKKAVGSTPPLPGSPAITSPPSGNEGKK